jgi:Zn-dependent peptidase ImmA (M78 family)
MSIKKIKIRCFTYTVHFVRQSTEDHGATETDSKEIFINTRFSLQNQRETLNHELLHAILEGTAIYGKKYEKDEDQEEDLILAISPTLVQIYQDNKWLRDFVFGKCK